MWLITNKMDAKSQQPSNTPKKPNRLTLQLHTAQKGELKVRTTVE